MVYSLGEHIESAHPAVVDILNPWNTELIVRLVQRRRQVAFLHIVEAYVQRTVVAMGGFVIGCPGGDFIRRGAGQLLTFLVVREQAVPGPASVAEFFPGVDLDVFCAGVGHSCGR